MFKTIQKVHFAGIGGAGMSGIAEVLLNLGYQVSGSDLKETDVTKRLQTLGATVSYKHNEKNVGEAQVVVFSTMIESNNPEIVFAKRNKIPIIPRIEMLAELARLKYTIAVAGTHGKTTTTSLIASILQGSGLDPTFVIGGKLNHLQSGAKLGQGEFLVAEADESDGSFLKLSPTFALITNIDNDHLDYYKSMKNLRCAFKEFANRVPFYGSSIVCLDDPGVQSILPYLNRRVLTYGFCSNSDLSAGELSSSSDRTQFTLLHHKRVIGKIEMKLCGRHNVLNVLAAVLCGLELKIPFEKIAHSIQNFENVERRLEKRGEKNGTVWIDDYGHHPAEIRAVISALKEKFPDKKIVVLFQPHRFSRTKILLKEFGKCFTGANEVILLPIYPAGEKPIPNVSSEKLVSLLEKTRTTVSLLNGGKTRSLENRLKPNTIFLTCGAGDVWKVGEKLFAPVD